MWHCHELSQSRTPKESVVRAAEVDHLEPDRLAAIVALGTEDHVQPDLADWGMRLTRHDAVEDGVAGKHLHLTDPQLVQGILVQDVDAAATVDETVAEPEN